MLFYQAYHLFYLTIFSDMFSPFLYDSCNLMGIYPYINQNNSISSVSSSEPCSPDALGGHGVCPAPQQAVQGSTAAPTDR